MFFVLWNPNDVAISAGTCLNRDTVIVSYVRQELLSTTVLCVQDTYKLEGTSIGFLSVSIALFKKSPWNIKVVYLVFSRR